MTKLSVSRALICGLSLSVFATAQCPPPGGYGGGGGEPAPPPPGAANVSGPTSGSPGAPTAPQPGGPSSPRPNNPAAPTPPGPATPRAGVPAAGRTAAGPRTPRGMPITLARGATSKGRLKVDWKHPVPPKRDAKNTSAAGAMPLQAALAELWEKDDGRPLLVLRECRLCQGSDGALLNRSLANDKTMLLTKWFRTVKLPPHVAEKGHPFFNVFQGYDFKHGWPHFFLLAHPGAEPVAFNGQQTQSQLWRAMFGVLEERYAGDPKRALKKWLAVLDRYDVLDARELQLKESLLEVRAKDGPKSSKAKKLNKKLAELAKDRKKLEAQEKKVRDLGLQKMPKPQPKVAAK